MDYRIFLSRCSRAISEQKITVYVERARPGRLVIPSLDSQVCVARVDWWLETFAEVRKGCRDLLDRAGQVSPPRSCLSITDSGISRDLGRFDRPATRATLRTSTAPGCEREDPHVAVAIL